jgi:hypothetical protein
VRTWAHYCVNLQTVYQALIRTASRSEEGIKLMKENQVQARQGDEPEEKFAEQDEERRRLRRKPQADQWLDCTCKEDCYGRQKKISWSRATIE